MKYLLSFLFGFSLIFISRVSFGQEVRHETSSPNATMDSVMLNKPTADGKWALGAAFWQKKLNTELGYFVQVYDGFHRDSIQISFSKEDYAFLDSVARVCDFWSLNDRNDRTDHFSMPDQAAPYYLHFTTPTQENAVKISQNSIETDGALARRVGAFMRAILTVIDRQPEARRLTRSVMRH